MQLLSVHPTIHYFDTFSEFASGFQLTAEDLIFTEAIIYNSYIKDLNLPCHVIIRDDYETGEPSEEAIDKILQDIEKLSYNRMVAVGGGSVMDTAKALVIDGAYPFAHLADKTEPNTSSHPLINIPTTCGTGAEISSGGIYFMKSNGLKTSIVGPGVDYAVLIPQLIEKLPFKIFFLSSMDALSHAVEGYLYADSCVNEFGLAIARAAITTILECHADLYLHGADYRVKLCRKFLSASTMGNMALTAAGANLVHAMAYPVAEKFHMAHGESVYQYLIPVLKLYERTCPDVPRLKELADMIRPILARAGFEAGENDVFEQLQNMLNAISPLRTMTEVGMTEADIEPFTRNIVETKQRLLTKALIPVSEEMIVGLFRERL